VLAQTPADQVTDDGVPVRCLSVDARSGKKTLQVRAFVDASDQMLRSLGTFVLREGRLQPVNLLVVTAFIPGQ